uniref:Uncharacterized protein n=1 Tax=Brassica oleracea var. oleracea TaxID=109376 RepID=A0A0D2ZRG9_BRAOL
MEAEQGAEELKSLNHNRVELKRLPRIRVHAARLVLVRDTFLLSKFCPTQRQRQQKIIEIVIYPAGKQCRAQMISPSTAQPLLSVEVQIC